MAVTTFSTTSMTSGLHASSINIIDITPLKRADVIEPGTGPRAGPTPSFYGSSILGRVHFTAAALWLSIKISTLTRPNRIVPPLGPPHLALLGGGEYTAST